MIVQHRLDADRLEEETQENTHVPVRCPACMALHFVNSTIGKLLGEASSGQPDRGQRSA